MTSTQQFQPDWVSPPGDTVADALEELRMSQADLALRTGFTRKHINRLLRGNVAITAEAAVRLEAVLGEPASFWLSREAQYREALARRAAQAEAAANEEWLRELPVAWMRRQGWINDHKRNDERVRECLRFFGVASVRAWRDTCSEPLAGFRSPAAGAKRLGAIASWLRAAELEAARITCQPYDRAAFRGILHGVRELTTEADPSRFIPKLQSTCADGGVAVVLIPAPPGCSIRGATRWLSADRALLALTLSHKTSDQLWFNFFHEAGHILHHGKKLLFIEGIDSLDPDRETEADRFAANALRARYERAG